jgi:hypothetical protein
VEGSDIVLSEGINGLPSIALFPSSSSSGSPFHRLSLWTNFSSKPYSPPLQYNLVPKSISIFSTTCDLIYQVLCAKQSSFFFQNGSPDIWTIGDFKLRVFTKSFICWAAAFQNFSYKYAHARPCLKFHLSCNSALPGPFKNHKPSLVMLTNGFLNLNSIIKSQNFFWLSERVESFG